MNENHNSDQPPSSSITDPSDCDHPPSEKEKYRRFLKDLQKEKKAALPILAAYYLNPHALKAHNKMSGIIYYLYQERFFHFLRGYKPALQGSPDAIASLYHDTLADFVKKARAGKYQPMKNGSSLKTYLFAIGKYKASNYLRKQSNHVQRHQPISDNLEKMAIDQEKHLRGLKEFTEAQIQQLLPQLKEKERELLRLYLKGYKHYEIAAILGFKDASVSKSKKSQILRKLRNLSKPHKK